MYPICFLLEESPPPWTGSINPMPMNLLHCRSLQCVKVHWPAELKCSPGRFVTSLSSVWCYFCALKFWFVALCSFYNKGHKGTLLNKLYLRLCPRFSSSPFSYHPCPDVWNGSLESQNYNRHSLNGRKLTGHARNWLKLKSGFDIEIDHIGLSLKLLDGFNVCTGGFLLLHFFSSLNALLWLLQSSWK